MSATIHKAMNANRAERGAMVVKSYGDDDLSRLLTDLLAYADTLGPAAFDNNLHAARTRFNHSKELAQ